MTECRPSVRGL